MQLYHFTTRHYLDLILQEGITKGEVQITWRRTITAPWLTQNPNPADQVWAHDRERLITDQERQRMYDIDRVMPPPGSIWPNKREVRLTVEIPDGDDNLFRWPDFARLHGVKRSVARKIQKTGGDWKDWYLYDGKIPPEWIVEVIDAP